MQLKRFNARPITHVHVLCRRHLYVSKYHWVKTFASGQRCLKQTCLIWYCTKVILGVPLWKPGQSLLSVTHFLRHWCRPKEKLGYKGLRKLMNVESIESKWPDKHFHEAEQVPELSWQAELYWQWPKPLQWSYSTTFAYEQWPTPTRRTPSWEYLYPSSEMCRTVKEKIMFEISKYVICFIFLTIYAIYVRISGGYDAEERVYPFFMRWPHSDVPNQIGKNIFFKEFFKLLWWKTFLLHFCLFYQHFLAGMRVENAEGSFCILNQRYKETVPREPNV